MRYCYHFNNTFFIVTLLKSPKLYFLVLKANLNGIARVLDNKMDIIARNIQKLLPRNKIDVFGKDGLLTHSLPYYVLALLTFLGLCLDQPNPWPFIAIVYAGFPLLDQIFSLDVRNPTETERRQLENEDCYFRLALYAAMILDWAMFVKICIVMQNFTLSWSTLVELVGIIFIASNLSSAQFAVAHEVMHKPGKFYRYLATLHMLKLCYTHFTYHHLYRHHQQVATPADPSTARKGETVYQFIVRCISGSWRGVYEDERRAGKKIIENYAVLSLAASFLFVLGVLLVFGLKSMLVHLAIAAGAIIYLQAINYLEHYGLIRRQLPNGSYQKVTILHSWNAPHRFTNYLLFKLQRHSDHHENSAKPYQTLLTLEESPFLPHGYTLMILMTFFPKVWFRVIDPLVEAYRRLQLEDRGKISPEVKEKADVETRKFLIQIGISALVLTGLSVCDVI